MEYSRKYYGNAILDENEVEDKTIIELDYFKTKENGNYGLEIIKKVFKDNIRTNEVIQLPKVTNSEALIDDLLSKIHKYKVTPVSLSDVINDYFYSLNQFSFKN